MGTFVPPLIFIFLHLMMQEMSKIPIRQRIERGVVPWKKVIQMYRKYVQRMLCVTWLLHHADDDAEEIIKWPQLETKSIKKNLKSLILDGDFPCFHEQRIPTRLITNT